MRLAQKPDRLLVLGFAAMVLAGAVLLALPISSADRPIAFIDALFTATSAVCVTGLSVVDTGTAYSGFGQVVILLLIQVGGLGITTLSSAIFILLGQRISLSSGDAVKVSFAQAHSFRLGSLLKWVFGWTILIEAIGALLLFLEESQRLPLSQAIWFSIFHAVSAFCNAGFGLRPDNLVSDRTNAAIVLPIAALIILGGIGFAVLIEMVAWLRLRARRHRFALSLHSKLALGMTGILLLVGMVGFAFLERHNLLQGATLKDTFLTSLFASVTARTAGFNTVSYGQVTAATLYLTIALMAIGGCPGSTAGGIKATTLGVIIALARSRFRGDHDVRLFNRRVPDAVVSKSVAVISLASFIVILAVILLSASEVGGGPHAKSVEWSLGLLFEVVSALATVGLSTGITPELSPAGKFILIILMFVGRLGPLTVAVAISRHRPRPPIMYAEEPVMIG